MCHQVPQLQQDPKCRQLRMSIQQYSIMMPNFGGILSSFGAAMISQGNHSAWKLLNTITFQPLRQIRLELVFYPPSVLQDDNNTWKVEEILVFRVQEIMKEIVQINHQNHNTRHKLINHCSCTIFSCLTPQTHK